MLHGAGSRGGSHASGAQQKPKLQRSRLSPWLKISAQLPANVPRSHTAPGNPARSSSCPVGGNWHGTKHAPKCTKTHPSQRDLPPSTRPLSSPTSQSPLQMSISWRRFSETPTPQQWREQRPNRLQRRPPAEGPRLRWDPRAGPQAV